MVEAVKKHQTRASEQQKTAYDFRASFQYYSEGELVWVQNKSKKHGVKRRYKGPFKVIDRVTEFLYRLVRVEGGQESVVHFNRLKPLTSSLPLPLPSCPASGVREEGQTNSLTRSS